jgi:hypothetical protein
MASVLHPLGEKRRICVTYISGVLPRGVLPRGVEKKLLKDGRRILSLGVGSYLCMSRGLLTKKNSHATTGDPRLVSRDANIFAGRS